MTKTNRIIWIDWLKAILINTVIIGHTYSSIAPIIYLFHMPLFFFISGMLTNIPKQREQGLWSSIKALIYGILVWNAIFIILNAILIICFGISINPEIDASTISINSIFLRPLLGVIFCNYSNNALPLIPQFWFVWTLILCKICLFFLSYLNKRIICLVLVFCISITFINTSIINLSNNYYLTRLIASMPFFVSGYMCKNNKYIMKEKTNILSISITTLLFISAILYMYFCNTYGINYAHYKFEPNYVVAILVFIPITLFLIELCKLLPLNSIIKTISSGTFFILAIHRLPILLFNGLLSFDKTSIILSLIISMICYPMINYIGKKAPILMGKIS